MADEVKLEVVQADRDRAADYLRKCGDPEFADGCRLGDNDRCLIVQAFAAHRIDAARQSRDDVVEALELVAAAMLRDTNGNEIGHGWDITALNRARPLIRRALRTPQTDDAAHADGKEGE